MELCEKDSFPMWARTGRLPPPPYHPPSATPSQIFIRCHSARSKTHAPLRESVPNMHNTGISHTTPTLQSSGIWRRVGSVVSSPPTNFTFPLKFLISILYSYVVSYFILCERELRISCSDQGTGQASEESWFDSHYGRTASLLRKVENPSYSHPAFYSLSTGLYFPRYKAAGWAR